LSAIPNKFLAMCCRKEGAPKPDRELYSGKGYDSTQPNVFYFASPYTAKSVLLQEERYLKAVLAAAELGERGFCLIEPIGMSHHSAKIATLPTGYAYWQRRDRAFIECGKGVIVLDIDGWFNSVGVTDEIHYAFEIGKRVWMYKTDFEGNSSFMELDRNSYLAAKREQAARG
jgi:hypothetical protein